MATLGVWFVGVGTANAILGGVTVRVMDQGIRALALERFLGVPLAVWLALAALAVAWVIQTYTRLGRYIYAIGGGEDLAALSGIDVRRVRIAVFTLAGTFYGLGGIIAAAQQGAGFALIGQGRLFTTITAVVVGGTALMGGSGGVLQTLVGVLIVMVLEQRHGADGHLALRPADGPGRDDHHGGGALGRPRPARDRQMSAPAPVLALRHIDKAFPGVKALDDVSLEVRPHEVVGLIGENGAGKSTLMRILAGVYQPDAGTLELHGAPVVLQEPQRCRPPRHRHGVPGAVAAAQPLGRREHLSRRRACRSPALAWCAGRSCMPRPGASSTRCR